MAEILNYSIRINGGPEGSVNFHRAEIFLFGTNGKVIGLIQFYDDGEELPASSSGEFIEMALPVSRLHDMVDLLRNEKPVYLQWQSAINCGYVSTGMEPTGEGE